MSSPGRTFSRLELLDQIQGTAFVGYERTIDVHIRNLRSKIETNPSQPRPSRLSMEWGTVSSRIKSMRSITLKLVLAFLAVSLVGIAWMAVSAGQITERVFGSFLDDHNTDALIDRLSDYYTTNEHWRGVEALIISQSFANEFGRGFIFTDEKGSIIFT